MKNGMRVGLTASTFDLFHAGHVTMLQEAKRNCDYLIAAIQTDPTTDRPAKNKPIQTIVERQLQVKACKYVDEVIVYSTEKDLEDLLKTLPIDVRILGIEYKDTNFTGKDICMHRNIDFYYNSRDHSFSSTDLRKRVYEAEKEKYEQTCINNSSATAVTQNSK